MLAKNEEEERKEGLKSEKKITNVWAILHILWGKIFEKEKKRVKFYLNK